MHIEMNPGGASFSALSMKLSSLQPKKRASNRTKFSVHYQDIVAAIERGVSMKDIRDALAEDGLTLSSATFNRLLKEEALNRKPSAVVNEPRQAEQEVA